MGLTIQAESTLERNFLVMCEYSNKVFEFWDQPESVGITFEGANGKSQRTTYTADVLVIEQGRAVAYQVKPQQRCEDLVKQRPQRWRAQSGRYEDLAAEDAFRSLGITHAVVTEDDTNPVRCENYALLLQARRSSLLDDPAADAKFMSILDHEPVLTFRELLRRASEVDATRILRLIDRGKVAALLDRHRLTALDEALLGTDRQLLADVASARESLQPRVSAEGVSHAAAPTVRQLIPVVQRLAVLNRSVEAAVCARTERRWRQTMREAGGNVLALVPQTHKRGNRMRRTSPDDLSLMHQAIASILMVPNPPKPVRGFYAYKRLHLERHGLDPSGIDSGPRPVSLPTFMAELRRIPIQQQALAQGGRRSANALAEPIRPEARAPKPLRAFERAHIDHYLVDQHVVVGTFSKKKKTKRPWLTVMVDQAAGVVLAISVAFRAPSRRSCASVMRDCVRRHGRLPETMVLDNGSEFQSVYFEMLLARYGVSKQDRPPGDPRFGGQIEAVFHDIKEELILSLRGSTANDQRGRSISPSHRGQVQACWKLQEVYYAYEHYFLTHFNQKVRADAMDSADQRFDDQLASFTCSGIQVAFDEAFLIATAIPMDRLLTVDPCRGITHLGRWYFHPELLTLPYGARVEALEDPWNDRCILASVNGRWVACFYGPTQGSDGWSRVRMFESIVYLENQDIRRKDRDLRYLALEQQLAEHRAEEASAMAKGEMQSEVSNMGEIHREGRNRPKLLPPSTQNATPYSTHQGDWDGYRKHR
jgi:transposase InsO family protein